MSAPKEEAVKAENPADGATDASQAAAAAAAAAAGMARIKPEFIDHEHQRKLAVEYLPKDVAMEMKKATWAQDAVGNADEGSRGPPKKRGKFKGRNKKRPIEKKPEDSQKFCYNLAAERECPSGSNCRFDHNLEEYLGNKPPDIGDRCHLFETFGKCPHGVVCRFAQQHLTEDHKNVVNEELQRKMKDRKFVLNILPKNIQAQLWKKKYDFSRANLILKDLQRSKDAQRSAEKATKQSDQESSETEPLQGKVSGVDLKDSQSGDVKGHICDSGPERSRQSPDCAGMQQAGTVTRPSECGPCPKEGDYALISRVAGGGDSQLQKESDTCPPKPSLRDSTVVDKSPSVVKDCASVVKNIPSVVKDSPTGVNDSPAGVNDCSSGVKDCASEVKHTSSLVKEDECGSATTVYGAEFSLNGGMKVLDISSDASPRVDCPDASQDDPIQRPGTDTLARLGSVSEGDTVRIRSVEKKKIDFRDKLYLAPLTTVGNLPFRRLCKNLGADITCGEMALTTNLLQGNQSEWALCKRHETEDLFGVQLCGSFPDTMTRCAQLLSENLELDFLDINCGCPIDFIYKRGEGCALMSRTGRFEQVIAGMTSVTDTPITVKVRTGIYEDKSIAHSLLPKLRDWGVQLVTVHGRSREQRYTRSADWDYIAKCAQVAAPMPVFGNGDILSYEEYFEHRQQTGVAGAMIARGGLIKPWVFTEIKEQRHWDISAGERLDLLRTFVHNGLEHWGSDQQGIVITRRFLLEWLSFLYRYIPVGVLESVPQRINEMPPFYFGRNDLETLMASPNCADWIKISEMLLGPVAEGFTFLPKHRANAYQ